MRLHNILFISIKLDNIHFINKDDNKWIMEKLLPNIESRNLKLCLHERDWLAGRLISDNIVESIESSEKVN